MASDQSLYTMISRRIGERQLAMDIAQLSDGAIIDTILSLQRIIEYIHHELIGPAVLFCRESSDV